MSLKATRWAKKQAAGGPMAKLLLMLLAEHADPSGYCYPSMPALARDGEMGRATVARNLERLVSSGLIQREQRVRPNGAMTSNGYSLLMTARARRSRDDVGPTEASETPPPSQSETPPPSQSETPPPSQSETGAVSERDGGGLRVRPPVVPSELLEPATEPVIEPGIRSVQPSPPGRELAPASHRPPPLEVLTGGAEGSSAGEVSAVITTLRERTGKAIDEPHAELIIRQLLGDRSGARDRIAYLVGAIRNDSNPRRFLPTYTPPNYQREA